MYLIMWMWGWGLWRREEDCGTPCVAHPIENLNIHANTLAKAKKFILTLFGS